MVGRFTKGSLSVSMIVGTVLVPLSAVAALWLTDAEGTDVAAPATSTTATTTPITLDTAPGTTEAGATRADLETACGPEGRELVDLEEEGTISDVQQAALDALRDLCEQQGLALPVKAAGEPIVRTVVVPASTVTTAVTATTSTTSDDRDEYDDRDEDDRYEDEHDDRDEDEDHEDDDRDEGEDREDDDHEDEDDD